MNTKNLFYAGLGGSIVALAWIASNSLTLSAATSIIGFFAITVIGALAVSDYGIRFKRLAR